MRRLSDDEIIAAARRRSGLSWRSPGGPVFQLPLLAIFLVALLAPEDVLDRYPLAGDFVAAVRAIQQRISGWADIQRFAEETHYPQVALLVCALHWAWLPLATLAACAIFEYVRRRERYVAWRFMRGDDGRVRGRDFGMAVSGLLLFGAAAVVLTMSPVPGALMTESRLGMGLTLWCGFWVGGILLGVLYPLLRTFVDLNLRAK